MALADSRNDIIDAALEIIGAKAADESAQAADVSIAEKFLNRMVKRLQATGAHLWTRNEATLFISAGVISYQIGGTANATENFGETTTTADLTAGETTIPVDSITDIIIGDELGVRLDDGTINFSPVVSIGVSDVVITTGLVSASTSGKRVYFYTTRIEKALRIPDARRKNSGQEIAMIQMGRIDYLDLPNKESQGTPVQYYYDPKQNTGTLFLWPSPAVDETLVTFTYYKPLDIFDNANDQAEFPDEWIEALIFGLADRLFYPFSQPKPQGFREDAYQAINDALDWDQGDASMFLAYSESRQ